MPNRNHGQAPDCVAVKDTQLVYRACTRQFAVAVGFERPEDIIGKSDFDLFNTDIARSQLNHDTQVVVHGQPDIGSLPLDTEQELVIVRTPVLSAKKQVRGIDIRLLTRQHTAGNEDEWADDTRSLGGVDYQTLVDQGLQGSMVLRHRDIVFANTNAAQMLGFGSAAQLLSVAASALFSAEDWQKIQQVYPASLHERNPSGSTIRLRLTASKQEPGSAVQLLAKAQAHTWQGESAVLLSFVDVDAEALSNLNVTESELRYRHYAKASADFFWELDQQLRFSYVSDDVTTVLQLSAEEIIGKTHQDLLKLSLNQEPEGHWTQHIQQLQRHEPFRDFEFRWGGDAGATEDSAETERPRTIRYSGIPVYSEDNSFIGYRGTGRDVTAASRQAESVAYHASHDALTGLVNRRHFEALSEQALRQARNERQVHALCFMDLDQFKIVNDTCGHMAGDELLRQLSALFDRLVRKSDVLARMGGDEFALLLYNCSVPTALKLANQIRSEVENFQFLWGDSRFQVGVSVGLVVFDDRWENLQALFAAADSACYLAKNEGRNRVVVYREADGPDPNRRVETHWVEEINTALDEHRMFAARQVIVPLNDLSDTTRFEMFMRMKTPGGEVINPGAFLPSAERYGLSSRLDLVVTGLTLDWLKSHPRLLNSIKWCSINLTSGTFAHEDAEQQLTELILASGIPPSRLCFELTETATIANLTVVSGFMRRLSDIGCAFMLDDFGSGLSAFAYLKSLPVSYIKIDGSLIKNILDDPLDYAMVKAISEISQSLGMQTVAKYVESQELLDAVRDIGVDYVQGYRLGKTEIVES